MGLADFFRRHTPDDPFVQAGIISRPQNWQMRLGSLAAALGNMDRPGMLGQALAQAGAIYQDQRQGALTSAFERMQEESKQARQEEIYQQNQEDRRLEQAKARTDAAAASKKTLEDAEKEFKSRAALQWALHGLGMDPSLADNPTLAKDFIDEEQAKRRENAKPAGAPTVHNLGGGSVLEYNPQTGQFEQKTYKIPQSDGGKIGDMRQEDIEALIRAHPDQEAAIRLNPRVAASQLLQRAFDATGKTTDPRSDMERRMKEVREDDSWVDSWKGKWIAEHTPPGEMAIGIAAPEPSDEEVLEEAMQRKRFLDALFPEKNSSVPTLGPQRTDSQSDPSMLTARAGSFSSLLNDRAKELRGGTKTVRPSGGEQLAGTVLPSPKVSSPATGKAGVVRGVPKKTEAEALGLARLENSVANARVVLPPDQAAALSSVVKAMTAKGIDPEEIAAFLDSQVQLVGVRRR